MNFDVIVVGGGHAGSEAAAAAARLKARVCLITFKLDNIGQMSCNPSIGGVGKGIIVREIDALDGVMGKAADLSGIHFKMLNFSKGPAVWGPRAQADRTLYQKAVMGLLTNYSNLVIKEAEVIDLIIQNDTIKGVVLKGGEHIYSRSVVLTTGTFLGGVIHVGPNTSVGGRYNENASELLAEKIRSYNFKVGRLKTGTPARIDKTTINWDVLEPQIGDIPPKPFSYMTEAIEVPQIPCYITYTSSQTHEIITQNIHKSAMYSGKISGVGPRYCPSIEDKVARFKDKERHQIFLEPEGLDSDLVYPNGISTSLPQDVQEKFIRSIKGLEKCKIVRFGYAIEYDYIDPRELKPTLETNKIKRLFLAGQINGTTGYEEAAGQGIIAGINAALENREYITSRSESYIGVMINDLTTNGTTEPYRMMTSRAEYRLYLRADNADLRLTQRAMEYGIITEDRKKVFIDRLSKIDVLKTALQNKYFTPQELKSYGIELSYDGVRRSVYKIMGLPKVSLEHVFVLYPQYKDCKQDIIEHLKAEAMYEPFLNKIEQDIKILKLEENIKIPSTIDYEVIAGLSSEVKQKLLTTKPINFADAKRISGITPAALIALYVYIKAHTKKS